MVHRSHRYGRGVGSVARLPELIFHPVFDYRLVLAVPKAHPLAARPHVLPQDLISQTLLTVPVTEDRLDIYTRFLLPAACRPAHRRTAETVELILQLAAAGRGLAVLPDWLVAEAGLGLVPLAIGPSGLAKSIHVGLRADEAGVDYLRGFLTLAGQAGLPGAPSAGPGSPPP